MYSLRNLIGARFFSLFLCMVGISIPTYMFAQTPSNTIPEGTESTFEEAGVESVVLATVNVHDVATGEIGGGEYGITFTLSNREGVQPNITYSVQLSKLNEKGAVAYNAGTFTAPNKIMLGENENLPIAFKFRPSQSLESGKYLVELFVHNAAGLLLAYMPGGVISLDTEGGVVIDSASCALSIEGEDADTVYTIDQGVDVTAEERMILTCQVTNMTKSEVRVQPAYATYRRNFGSGEKVEHQPIAVESITLASQERKIVAFTLPQASEPQAYDILTTLTQDNGDQISNQIIVHYVLRGVSGTIQNTLLDKTFYAVGDVAQATVTIAPSADTFPNSRTDGNGTVYEEVILEAQLTSGGSACTERITKKVSSRDIQVNMELPIISDCAEPVMNVKMVKADDGVLLDAHEMKLGKNPVSISEPIEFQDNNSLKALYVLIGMFVVMILAAFLLYRFIKHKTKPSNVIGLLIFAAVAGMGGAQEASADTVAYKVDQGMFAYWGYLNITYNIDKSAYMRGDTMTVTAVGNYGSCTNDHDGILKVYVKPNANLPEELMFSIVDKAVSFEVKSTDEKISFLHSVTGYVKDMSHRILEKLAILYPRAHADIENWYTNKVMNYVVDETWSTVSPEASFRFRYEAWYVSQWSKPQFGTAITDYRTIPYSIVDLSQPVMYPPMCNSDGTQVTLQWNQVPRADSYPLRVDDLSGSCLSGTSGFDNLGCQDGVEYVSDRDAITGSVSTLEIKPSTAYEWWVQAYDIDADEWSTYSKVAFTCEPMAVPPACSNGLDDDGDSKIDYIDDKGCTSATDTDETDPIIIPPACSNGLDDDGDSMTDYPDDIGCSAQTDDDETDVPSTSGGDNVIITPTCSNGLDDDGDSMTDYPDDIGCTSWSDTDEASTEPLLTVNKRVVEIGDSVELTWETSEVSCTIAGGEMETMQVTASGKQSIEIRALTEFTIDCGQSGSDTLTVEVVPQWFAS